MTTKAREKGANMISIGVDFHPSFQQIAFMDQETGECGDRRLNHSDGEAERFYKELKERGVSVRVGLEATGYSRWFERLLAELGFEVWIGDAAENQETARTEAENRPRGRPTPVEVASGESLSSNLDTESGES
jgi:hypothetical protein